DAKAIAVATDHIGKANAVMAPLIPNAARPYLSPINPETVTTNFSRNGPIITKAIIKTCTVSATPYQIADIPVKYDNSKIEINVDPENSRVIQKATIHLLKVRPPTKKPSPPATAFLRESCPAKIKPIV